MHLLISLFMAIIPLGFSANILMVTLSPTLSHKMPFTAYAKGLIARKHNVTFVTGFPPENTIDGLHEITPQRLAIFFKNFTNWDLISGRKEKLYTVDSLKMFNFLSESCDVFLPDPQVQDLLKQQFDLLILDGVFTECALALHHFMQIPFMYFNTIAFAADVLSVGGNPVLYSVVPTLFVPNILLSDSMSFFQRCFNAYSSFAYKFLYNYAVPGVEKIMRQHMGDDLPTVNHMKRNVSFILQNGHHSVTYPRPFLPNVAEIACLHCRPATSLPTNLVDFINGSGEAGFIYVSMGTAIRTMNTPKYFFKMLLNVFGSLPCHVLWNWDTNTTDTYDLPSNVRIERWVPQQDILGHPKIRGFFTHGGLFSLLETVYHGVPIVVMPIYYDQDANGAAAVTNGFGVVIQITGLTGEKLHKALSTVVNDPKYRSEAKKRQRFLRDQRTPPLDTAVYWTEYVLKYKGAYHLQTPARNLGFVQYYGLDMLAMLVVTVLLVLFILSYTLFIRRSTRHIENKNSSKEKRQ